MCSIIIINNNNNNNNNHLMFDISWGELLVVGVVGAAVTGRKDLPAAFRVVGTQLGRVVGLLQGARARADQFAAKNELRQLQNELRSGLRELDQVRTELAVAASSQGMVGRTLGATTPSANRRIGIPPVTTGSSSSTATTTTFQPYSAVPSSTAASATSSFGAGSSASAMAMMVPPSAARSSSPSPSLADGSASGTSTIAFDLPAPNHRIPIASLASHSEKAALEDEWEKQGIGFQTQAEQIYKQQRRQQQLNSGGGGGGGGGGSSVGPSSGSELLESLIKQNLIWDQYDRVVGEQDSQLQDRIEAMKAKRRGDQDNNKDGSDDVVDGAKTK